ncbi:uncharacterized protein SPSK_02673 [Sporothrix schenckii 1099-18]|uniref:DUF7702 domain-containing protein n=2 Tax=Sporothrix schenckii TaxID=29908 RepID=U7PQI3_SPOS1|nr:uncharacterized protein SPSK_02673 [Sporothrix schenckii 1099-18]ERS96984.1 hypothetical protein HMPREF1624_06311 [Sporothrix schenckii ATCC 58251]KJR86176.1 hypothetical protein SPSK_02673 [Sporothrix schenckii 1099-18]
MALTIYNDISIVQLVFFLPSLFIAGTLCYRHGIRRSAGWIYLVILSLMRIIGASMELATIASPDNVSLATGASILQTIGLSPLILMLLGLVTRTYTALPEHKRPSIPNAQILRLMQLVVIVGLILSIVGGTDMSSQVQDAVSKGQPISYTIPSLTKAGIALMIVGYVLVLLSSLILTTCLSSIVDGEKRLLMAVLVALPFVFVRLLYSILSAFDSSSANFHQFGGSTNAGYVVLGMCTIMEIISAIIFEVVGMTLPYVPHNERGALLNPTRANNRFDTNGQPLGAYPQQGQNGPSYPKLQPNESA